MLLTWRRLSLEPLNGRYTPIRRRLKKDYKDYIIRIDAAFKDLQDEGVVQEVVKAHNM